MLFCARPWPIGVRPWGLHGTAPLRTGGAGNSYWPADEALHHRDRFGHRREAIWSRSCREN